MRTAATFAMLAAISGAGASSAAAGPPPAKTLPFIAGLIAALAAAPDDAAVDAVLAHPPPEVTIVPIDAGWQVAFPPLDARALVTAWHWTDVFAVAPDARHRSFHVRHSIRVVAPDRIVTDDPRAGIWAVQANLVERPVGVAPKLVADSSAAYDLRTYDAAINQLVITRAPRPRAATMARLHALTPPIAMTDITEILGRPDRDVGSGLYVFSYALDDGTALLVGSADRRTVLYIHLMDGDRVIDDPR